MNPSFTKAIEEIRNSEVLSEQTQTAIGDVFDDLIKLFDQPTPQDFSSIVDMLSRDATPSVLALGGEQVAALMFEEWLKFPVSVERALAEMESYKFGKNYVITVKQTFKHLKDEHMKRRLNEDPVEKPAKCIEKFAIAGEIINLSEVKEFSPKSFGQGIVIKNHDYSALVDSGECDFEKASGMLKEALEKHHNFGLERPECIVLEGHVVKLKDVSSYGMSLHKTALFVRDNSQNFLTITTITGDAEKLQGELEAALNKHFGL